MATKTAPRSCCCGRRRGGAPPPVAAAPRALAFRRPVAAAAQPPPRIALLLEIDGAVVDIVQQGHRVAFNSALAELGVNSSAQWTPREFEASLRAGGTGEQLLAARLEQAKAWPPALGGGGAAGGATDATAKERQQLARRLHDAKQRAFAEMVSSGGLPLRPDVAAVVDGALRANALVALVSETASSPEDGVAAAALASLGEERAARVRVLTAGVRRQADEEEEAGGGEDEDDPSAGQMQLQAAVARQKAAAARDFAERLANSAVSVDVSALTALDAQGSGGTSSAASAAAASVSPAFFSAAATLLGVSPKRCACVAATAGTVRAAAAAGMVAVAVPRQAAFDASFPEAHAKFEAFGPGYLTWARLAAMVEAAGG
jgi:beta-phosphoglucomutase-like phosphatase (HAD superfamily)